jgi:hypothetical protein
MARGKSSKLAPFQKLMTVMVSGNPVTIEEIDATLGKEIQMYRLSTYIWLMKTNTNAVIKAIKNGRKITAYQLMNVDEVKEYMKRVGITTSGYTPVSQTITKLADLKSPELTDAQVEDIVSKVEQSEMTVTEVTENQTV